MRRGIASLWHASSLVLAGVLFFLFVFAALVRADRTMAGRAAAPCCASCAACWSASTALPVVLTLVRTWKPELGTPTLALSLRVWSIVGHIAAGVADHWEPPSARSGWIWTPSAPWLFGIYGAAAAIALLAAFAFYLAFVAELPPLAEAAQGEGRKAAGTSAGESRGPPMASAEAAETTPDPKLPATDARRLPRPRRPVHEPPNLPRKPL